MRRHEWLGYLIGAVSVALLALLFVLAIGWATGWADFGGAARPPETPPGAT